MVILLTLIILFLDPGLGLYESSPQRGTPRFRGRLSLNRQLDWQSVVAHRHQAAPENAALSVSHMDGKRRDAQENGAATYMMKGDLACPSEQSSPDGETGRRSGLKIRRP